MLFVSSFSFCYVHIYSEHNSTRVALQLPEGLFEFATRIVDDLSKLTTAQFFVLGDVSYGACCVADELALTFGADLFVHFGHNKLRLSFKMLFLINVLSS